MELLSVLSGGDVRNMVRSARLLDSSEELWCIMINNFVIFLGGGVDIFIKIFLICVSRVIIKCRHIWRLKN